MVFKHFMSIFVLCMLDVTLMEKTNYLSLKNISKHVSDLSNNDILFFYCRLLLCNTILRHDMLYNQDNICIPGYITSVD